MCAQSLSPVWFFAILWAVACQASLSVGFPSQEYWRELSLSPSGDLPHPGMEPTSPALAGGFFTTEPPRKPLGSWNMSLERKKRPRDVHVLLSHTGLGSGLQI